MHDKLMLPAAFACHYTAARVITVEYSDSAIDGDEVGAACDCTG